ncbi:MAG: class I SAM-dependent methyltransferase [Gammaproteobacteria bacterium]|nr:class I SAM-dependent methyltransferase [Gammaproteobacteria bacterium]
MKKKSKKGSIAKRVDKHLLYQESVQNTDFELDFIRDTFRTLRGRKPRSMREDFSGTSLAAVNWVGRSHKNTSVAVDIDPDVLAWGRQHNVSTLNEEQQQRLQLIEGDVLDVYSHQVDFIQAFNFSYWCFQERRQMLDYFSRCRANLKEDGILFLDAYGGFEAYKTQKEYREVGDFTYIWEQAEFNAVTCEQKCHIHFKFKDGSKLKRAFSYVWRIWGAKELREVLSDAGFRKTTLYLQAFDEETDEPLDEYIPTDEAGDYACWLGYIVAEK